MWNMTPTAQGDCFYECLAAELRGCALIPQVIRTKEMFDTWKKQELKGSPIHSTFALAKIESLFHEKLSIIVGDDTTPVKPKKTKGITVLMMLRNGVFSSPRYKRQTNAALRGLESVEFWLNNLAVMLSKNKADNSAVVFIVGTHLDRANPSSALLRSDRIMQLVHRFGIIAPVFIHEVSIGPMDGSTELMSGLTL
jgi:hypothetical protein